jgi:hypothetical protein
MTTRELAVEFLGGAVVVLLVLSMFLAAALGV